MTIDAPFDNSALHAAALKQLFQTLAFEEVAVALDRNPKMGEPLLTLLQARVRASVDSIPDRVELGVPPRQLSLGSWHSRKSSSLALPQAEATTSFRADSIPTLASAADNLKPSTKPPRNRG